MLSFSERVHKIVQKIPVGKVGTYGQVARLAGNPRAARAVGVVMRCNPNARVTPCHRVVAATGELTGYAFGKGVATKKQILLNEGVIFSGDRVNLKKSQWRC